MKDAYQLKSIALNNHAACLIESGNFSEAIERLKAAQKCVRYAFSMVERVWNERGESHDFFSIDKLMRHGFTDTTDDERDDVFIYRHPIQLPLSMSTVLSHPLKISVAIVFNLALAHHLIYLKKANKYSEIVLRKAAKLYEYALRLDQSQKTRNPSVLLLLVTASNCGQIQLLLNEEQQAKECFRRLFSTLIYLRDCHNVNIIKDFECFLRSSSIWIIHDGTPAAAAA